MSVKFNYDMGKVYDTAFYMMMHFHEHDFFANYRNRVAGTIDIDEAMRGFFAFKERCVARGLNIPAELAPFFHTDYVEGRIGFLIIATWGELAFDAHTLGGTVAFIKDRTQLKKLFWEHYFPDSNDGIAESLARKDASVDVANAVMQLAAPESIKLRLVSMADHFAKYQQTLVDTFKAVYTLVAEYHDEMRDSYYSEAKNQLDDKFVERLKIVFKMPASVPSFPFYCSMLNGILADYRVLQGRRCIGLGKYFRIFVESEYRYKHVTLQSFSKIMCVDTRVEIFEMFLRYKKLCVGDIADQLYISRRTIYQHINAMIAEEMIQYVDSGDKRRGERVDLALNAGYFNAYEKHAAMVNAQVRHGLSKGIDKYERPRKKRKSNDDYDEA